MENFVNFITDTINPALIDEYLLAEGTEADFTGSDASTADFTKIGWIMSCYRNMKEAGTADAEVDAMVARLATINTDNGINYELLSQSGFNIIQQMVFDARGQTDFTFNDAIAVIPGFEAYLNANLSAAANPGGQSALHMMIDFGMVDAINSVGGDYGSQSTDVFTSKVLAPYYLAIKKKYEDQLSGAVSRSSQVMDIVSVKAGAPSYNEFVGKNSIVSGATGDVKNELSRYILSTSHETLKATIVGGELDIAVDPAEIAVANEAMSSSVEIADGIAASKTKFDTIAYQAATNSLESNRGYNPLMMYINKYRASVKGEVLTYLGSKFSSLSISVDEDGTTEGFNAVGLMAYYMLIGASGTWNSASGAAFIKTALSSITAATAYQIWAVSGNVRDFTSGGSSNSFGAITNILMKINDAHQAWWNELDKVANPDATIHDYELTFTSLATDVFPALIDYSFYKIWMVEFGREIE